jgi:AcrR family transcriptional regulator
MQQSAGSLGISRATLYRRAGNRDQLFAAVIWSNSRATLVDAVRRTRRLRGVPRAVAVAAHVITVSDQSVPLRQFLASDPEAALRVLTGAHGGVQERFIDAFERLLALEAARGHLALSLDLASVSYAVVRIAEGYADAIADRDCDIPRAITLIDELLRDQRHLQGHLQRHRQLTSAKKRRGLSTSIVVICSSVTPRSRSAGSTSLWMCV